MDPWEKQACDTEASYGAFLAYRDQGPGRKLYMQGYRPQELRDWHDAHGWRERVAAYDRMIDAARVEAVKAKAERAAVAQDEEHRALLADARALVALELEKRVRDCLQNPMTPTMSVSELTRLVEQTVKLERLQDRKATEVVAVDLSTLTEDELAEAERIARKAKGNG